MDKNKIIVVGVGSGNDAIRMALEKHLKNGEEIIFVDSHKDAEMHEIGTVVTNEDIIKALESIPKESKPRPLSEILKEDPKPFILTAPKEGVIKPFFPEFNSPINAITTHKKKGKYRP